MALLGGAVVVFLTVQGAVFDVLAQRPEVSYYSLGLFAGLLPLVIGLVGHFPEIKQYKGTENVTPEMLLRILFVILCFVPVVAPALLLDDWIEDQGYVHIDKGRRHRFTPEVFQRVKPEDFTRGNPE